MSERPTQHISYTDLKTCGWEIEFLNAGYKYKVGNVFLNGTLVQQKDLTSILYTLGLDLESYGLSISKKKHRPLTNPKEIVSDFRFSAPERVDDAWTNSGCASEEVGIYLSKMSDMGDYLKGMGRGGIW